MPDYIVNARIHISLTGDQENARREAGLNTREILQEILDQRLRPTTREMVSAPVVVRLDRWEMAGAQRQEDSREIPGR